MISLLNPSAKASSQFAIGSIPQYDTDPAAPAPETAWILKQGGGVSGSSTLQWFHGLSLAVMSTGGAGAALTYQFSYRTLENTTKRVTIS